MLNLNLCENINLMCKCFPWFGKKRGQRNFYDDGLDRNIYQVSREYKISILPIIPNFDIDNLYPLTDHVELWNIFIVGNDKTYILASINDPHICLPQAKDVANHKGNNILPDELVVVFDSVWSKTLSGKQLQFYMVWNGKLYFINTYPFFNGQGKVIGAILFMRAFETMPETRFETLDGYIVPLKRSMDDTDGRNAIGKKGVEHRVSDNGTEIKFPVTMTTTTTTTTALGATKAVDDKKKEVEKTPASPAQGARSSKEGSSGSTEEMSSANRNDILAHLKTLKAFQLMHNQRHAEQDDGRVAK